MAHSLTELVVADLNVQVIYVHRVTDLVLVFSHGFAHAGLKGTSSTSSRGFAHGPRGRGFAHAKGTCRTCLEATCMELRWTGKIQKVNPVLLVSRLHIRSHASCLTSGIELASSGLSGIFGADLYHSSNHWSLLGKGTISFCSGFLRGRPPAAAAPSGLPYGQLGSVPVCRLGWTV